MGNFESAYNFTIRAEGCYSNHKNDRGGETNYGITKSTFESAKQAGIIANTIQSVQDITEDDAKKIYKTMFWDTVNGDALPDDLAIAVFDTAVNSGPKAAAKMLQNEVGATLDGKIGPQTLEKINNYDGDLVGDYLDAREQRFKDIVEKDPSQNVFFKGWINRINALRNYIENNAIISDSISAIHGDY